MTMAHPNGALATLLRLSRWRFWLYLAGTYLVGYTAGVEHVGQLLTWWLWIHLLFFTLPANLLLYGVNDLFDADTDSRNPKKGLVEHRLSQSERPLAWSAVASALVLALTLVVAQRSFADGAMLSAFVVLAVAYSTPPVRLKTRPILDSASNVLYAAPGFLGWQQASGQPVHAIPVLIAGLWTAAMHLFSAIPDIESDREAGLSTTATLVGLRGSLAVCTVLWLMFAGSLLGLGVLWPWNLAALIYPLIPGVLLLSEPEATHRFYWYFPAINSLMGMAGFFVVALGK